jgi:IclR family KDG regulon transcriptional repressor
MSENVLIDDSFAKGLRIIEVLAAADRPLGLTEVAERCGFVKSHAHKFLKTLVLRRYVQQKRERGPYALTFKLWELGARVVSRADLVSAARTPMQDLSASSGETVTLAVFDDDDAVYIYKIDGTQDVRTHTDVGRRRPAYCVAAGKVMLAYQPDLVVERATREMTKFTDRTVPSLETLREQLAQIRRDGYAVNWGEWTPNVRGIATPVRAGDGTVVAALNLSIPAQRLDPQRVATLAPSLLHCATRVSQELGYFPRNDATAH